jgi:hypothetical protein
MEMFAERSCLCGSICVVAVLTCSVAAGAGCGAQGTASRGQRTDVRAAALVAADEPTVLLAGPGWLLHVNSERRGPVAVYLVPKHQGTAADCRGPSGAQLADTHGRGSLYVRGDEMACATAPRRTRLSWHARPLPAADVNREAVASLQ